MRRPQQRLRDERGDLPAALLLIPLLLIMMELIIFTGRVSGATADLNAAAAEAARAGSLAGSASRANEVMLPTAEAVLKQRGVPCVDARVEPSPESTLAPGGIVVVEVFCTVKVGDLGFLTSAAPLRDVTLRGVAFESIDPLRVFDANG